MTLVNAETGELVEPMDADAARRLTGLTNNNFPEPR